MVPCFHGYVLQTNGITVLSRDHYHTTKIQRMLCSDICVSGISQLKMQLNAYLTFRLECGDQQSSSTQLKFVFVII